MSQNADAADGKQLWKPGLRSHAIALGDREVEASLPNQVMDPEDEEYGGMRSPETLICDGLAVPGVVRLWSTFFLAPDSRWHADENLLGRIRLALEYFEERALNADGSLNAPATGDWGSAAHAAFAAEGLYDLTQLWKAAGHPAAKEIHDRARRCAIRAGHAPRTAPIFTHNHRWAACAAMACAYDLEPDPRLIERIDDYLLGDGVDQDEDGYYAEYAAGYGMLTNRTLVRVADLLDRPHLFEHVRRSLDLLKHLWHSNGEVACEYSYRNNDRGRIGSPLLFVRMANKYRDGHYLTMAEDIIAPSDDPASEIRYGGLGALELMALSQTPHPGVDPEPLPSSYRKTFARDQVGRIRRGKFSATVMGRPANPKVPFLGKPFNRNFLAVRYGSAIIDGTRISYMYYGDREMGVPEGGLKVDGDEFVIQHDFTSHEDGPVPWRIVELRPEYHVGVRIREIEGGVAMRLALSGIPKVTTHLEFSVRPDGSRMIVGEKDVALVDGEQHVVDADCVKIVNGRDVLEIAGDIRLRHMVRPSGKFVNQATYTSVVVNLRTPYDGEITFRGHTL